MSKLKTYDREYSDKEGGGGPDPWRFTVVGGCSDPGCDPLMPGVWVTDMSYGGHGMVIAINDEQITILWSIAPKGGFENFAFPLVRRVFPPALAPQLVSIQPMTAPVGGIFYMDYTYGDKLATRCNSGPLVCRMFWKAYKWARQRTLSFGSSLRSWARWAHGRPGNSERLLDKWAPIAGSTNGPLQQKIVEEYLKQQASAPKTRRLGPSSCLR